MLRPHYSDTELALAHHYNEIRERLRGPPPPQPALPIAPKHHAFIETPPVKINAPGSPPIDDLEQAWAVVPPKTLRRGRIVYLIKRRVAREFPNMTVERMTGLCRDKQTVWPRHIAQYLVRVVVIPTISYPKIGRYFGHRDHTTILHAVHKCEWYMAQGDNVVSECIKRLRVEIEEKISLWKTSEENHVEDEGLAVR